MDENAVYLVGRRPSGCAYLHHTFAGKKVTSDEWNPFTAEHPHIVFKLEREIFDEAMVFDEVFIHYETKVCVAGVEKCDVLCNGSGDESGINYDEGHQPESQDSARMMTNTSINSRFGTSGPVSQGQVPLPGQSHIRKPLTEEEKAKTVHWNYVLQQNQAKIDAIVEKMFGQKRLRRSLLSSTTPEVTGMYLSNIEGLLQ